MEDEFEGKAEDGFSWIAVVEKIKKNPEEADIVSLALIYEGTEGKGILDCARTCTSPVAGENWIKEFINGLSEEDKKNIIEQISNITS